jgi:hypothetical protein
MLAGLRGPVTYAWTRGPYVSDGRRVSERDHLPFSVCSPACPLRQKAGILLVTGGLGRCVHGEQTRASRASTQADNESGSPAGMCVGRGWVPAR